MIFNSLLQIYEEQTSYFINDLLLFINDILSVSDYIMRTYVVS